MPNPSPLEAIEKIEAALAGLTYDDSIRVIEYVLRGQASKEPGKAIGPMTALEYSASRHLV